MKQDELQLRQTRVFEEELLPQIDALFNFACRLCQNAEDANDLVQETYMKAFRSLDKYEPGTKPGAWLFRILKNAFINDYRKKAKQPTQTVYEEISNFHEEEDTNFSSFVDLREELFNGMMGDEITAAIDAMPIRLRAAVLLYDVEGFSYEEIAEILEIPIGTVRSRIHRGRDFLKSKLFEYAQSMGYRSDGK
jgi:RNA polymerase sigma factor (sigma-70 family)